MGECFELALRLQTAETAAAVAAFEEMWGPDRSNCGGFGAYSGPCGGCYECSLSMLYHGLPGWNYYMELARVQLLGG